MKAGGAARSIFAGYHPLVNYLWFGYAILVPIFFTQPVYLAVSFASALAYSLYLGGRKALKFDLGFVLPLMVIAALFNPAFNHKGITILFYFHYNPITLESILYGICTAAMIGGVILFFTCYNALMTSDKFIYLFGRLVPAMSLIISMALRFIPRYTAQAKRIASARRGIGFDVSSGGFFTRLRNGGEVLSVMVTWALENGIETGDSMLSRGYGLPGRTAYSNYRFDARDRILLAVLAVLMAVSLACCITGAISVMYYPMFIMERVRPFAGIAYVCHGAVCLSPFALELREDAQWRSSRAGISAKPRARQEDANGTF
ncbi:MAG: energy-coupling factor transporter transmembrane protein EcfT [Clostridiales Family XIII bacterium]|jgi:energy-coupling factor transport system permease protein|nr:energy-coupling factor transporter transmembrane protein EcfT [Clostridiales Family XIII bacterium]